MRLDRNTNKLVAYSRAGDVFHYRWAARRCLRLIQANSYLESVIIEGSNEKKKAGEYVIDVSEYYNDTDSKKRIEYFQLKHTTVQQNKPFTLSGLKDTIVGFSKRYKQHLREKSLDGVSFTIITNRKIDKTFKQNLATIINGDKVNKRFSQTLKKYTKLAGKELIRFCSLLNLEDSEGDYNVQKEELRIEMSRLQPGFIDPAQVDSIVSLVQEKVLPKSNGQIIKEDILKPFGVTSERQLFPAPPLFEDLDYITVRDQYRSLLDIITTVKHPLIIQAEGGVGKSVFSQYLLEALPEDSLAIAYDCFGSGKYRSRSEPRHRHRDALVQIVNELASLGLCERMLVHNTTQESDIMHGFLSRIESSIRTLKKISNSARLIILIDAADNAEMAAQEFGDSCFANELLREILPQDCKLVLLCRPERTHLLKSSDSITKLNLLPFSKYETFENLKKWFPLVDEIQAFEFHRLTSGNPRVQMNSITAGHTSVDALLAYLGPSGTTVEKQIEQQLNTAVQKIKDALPENYQTIVSKICTGLASLPPNIPIQVLSQASKVKEEDVKSFVADFGRSLWLLDSSVQFRDEPTETWFRNTYLASKEDFISYIKILEPLSGKYTYVAQVLPLLYLQAGQYDQLIRIALSDMFLPTNNPIDTRNVLVYRLQFAFKAALRSSKFGDSIKLALRAGEEVAGDQRQQNLFQNNIDLLPNLLDKSKIQEIAFKGLLKSKWEGSDNVYTASLLSGIEEYQGEANGYLRSALNWLNIYFEESKKRKERDHRSEVSFDDILEIALVHLNLRGAKSCLTFLNSIKPQESIFRVICQLVNRLIDAGRFNEIDEILKNAQENKLHVLAVVSQLASIGRFSKTDDIEKCLNLLSNPKWIKKSKKSLHDTITPSVVTFLEVCLHRKMNTNLILAALDYYVPIVASQEVGSRFESWKRTIFLKALSIRKVISKDLEINLDKLMPKEYKSRKKERDFTEDIREFKEVIGGLFPWFLLRAQVITGQQDNLVKKANQANTESNKAYSNRYKSYDNLPKEIAGISHSILIYCNQQKPEIIQQYFNEYLRGNSFFNIPQMIDLLKAGNRIFHLNIVLTDLENSVYKRIQGLKGDGPEEIADHYISLARAVLSSSKDDAAVYFEEAINIVSKFGDEIVERWEAVSALGLQSGSNASDELAYRFIRCAELVGEYVDREKHWDRSGALITCANMSPQIGISALSRWRDRAIGRFDYQLESLLNHFVKSEVINSTVAWSMARFLSDQHIIKFLSTCLANESSKKLKNNIFLDAYELARKEGASSDYWVQMKSLADQYGIKCKDLDHVVDFYKGKTKESNSLRKKQRKKSETKEIKKWERVFQNVDILQPEGLAILKDRFSNEFNKKGSHHYPRSIDLYREILNRISANKMHDFINLLFKSDDVNHYDCKEVLKSISDDLKNKVSFKNKWPSIINHFGIRYAHELVNFYSFSSVVRDLDIDVNLAIDLKKGIFHGLSQGQEFADASILFGFVRHASTFIKAREACDLTDYALSRFELHVEDDFGDGPWNKWLHVSKDISRNIAGFIWSALGSPYSETRWRACHVVKKLADFKCTQVIDDLIKWLERNKVYAYGSNQFPFYNLHARQYLLIALSRASTDHPALLIGYKKIFFKYTKGEPHILIQKFSAEIALNIEKAIPGTYSSKETSVFKEIGKSNKETRKEEYDYQVDSYLHKEAQVDTTIDYRFGWDFDQYWYKPLGGVFGVQRKQIEELCANVIVHEWKLGPKAGYENDPRLSLWNRDRDRDTWHDHGNYPKTDNWQFYLSYHSMLSVAAKLVENMPVIVTGDWGEEDPWGYWLSLHLPTRTDSKWLADCRGPLPIQRPKWLTKDNYKHWRTDIHDHDFLRSINIKHGTETWINVKGGWTERHSSRYETNSVSTALVSKETSSALMRALSTCSNPYDYYLPDYVEDDMEFDSVGFQLKGWVLNSRLSNRIDEFDPYGNNMSYPSFSPGGRFLKKLKLYPDTEGITWRFSDGRVALKCNTWSSSKNGYDKEPKQSGKCLSASLTLLKNLCKVYNCHLIIAVKISRDFEYNHRPEDHENLNPSHKIYILSSNGRLKSTSKNYRLR